MKINIVADTHDTPAMISILSNLDNIYSLGDIAAVDTQSYLQNSQLYSECWKAYLNGTQKSLPADDKSWFDKLNKGGWEQQLRNIQESGKHLTVVQGNSDLRMLQFYPELRDSVNSEHKNFKFIPDLKIVHIENTTLILLPYRDNSYLPDLEPILRVLEKSDEVICLGHCPLYSSHQKKYYEHHYQAIMLISKKVQQATYLHGHVHADDTYRYSFSDISNLTVITPKATDSIDGMGSHHHFLQIDTDSGMMKVFELSSNKEIQIQDLPTQTYEASDHWNKFIKPTTK